MRFLSSSIASCVHIGGREGSEYEMNDVRIRGDLTLLRRPLLFKEHACLQFHLSGRVAVTRGSAQYTKVQSLVHPLERNQKRFCCINSVVKLLFDDR